jgi:hypothetical protein
MQVNLGQANSTHPNGKNEGEDSLSQASSDEHLIEFLNLPNGQHKSIKNNKAIEQVGKTESIVMLNQKI